MRCIDSYACRLFYSIYMQLMEKLISGFSRRQNKPPIESLPTSSLLNKALSLFLHESATKAFRLPFLFDEKKKKNVNLC